MPVLKSVLYLDLDDTLLSWASGRPEAVPGAHHFVLWALDHFEVRWLTRWCPDGEMGADLLWDLCKMLRIHPEKLQHIRGCSWEDTESKVNGIAWLDHFALDRPIVWVEDEKGVGERERSFLAEHGLETLYRHCNVTERPEAIRDIHHQLKREFGGGVESEK